MKGFELPFSIDQTADEYLSISTNIELYKIQVSQNCELQNIPIKHMNWAGYVEVTLGGCDPNTIARKLRNEGADAIFIYLKGFENNSILSYNGLDIPIFGLTEEHSGFFKVLDDIIIKNGSHLESILLHFNLQKVSFK